MLHTTFAKLKEAGACKGSYRRGLNRAGGIRKYGKDKPIPLSLIVEHNGLDDAIWCLRCTIEPSKDMLIEFACRCAEHVLHVYEKEYPKDNRPRLAIAAARHCISDKSAAAWAAGDAAEAAWAAAWAAAGAARAAAWAARAAAWAAAWAAGAARADAWADGDAARAAGDAARAAAGDAAEGEWQIKTFLQCIEVEF